MQGLNNLGATCAVNTMIQIICRNHYLRDSILKEDIPNNTLAIELKEILKIMYVDNNSLSPNKFIKNLYQSLSMFNFGEQLDLTELWLMFFDKICEEINYKLPDIKYNKKFENCLLNDPLINDKADYIINKFNNSKESSWLKNNQGVIINIIECNKCKNISYNFEPFVAIQLDLSSISDNSVSLTSLFRNYLKQTISKDEWKCEKCKENTEYKKTLKLWKVPNVLTFFIKRYIDINKKNNQKININRNININKGCIMSNKDLYVSYNISSIGCHIGNLNSGHYYAICKNEDGENFIKYDDMNINIYNKDNCNFLNDNKDCYMITYSI